NENSGGIHFNAKCAFWLPRPATKERGEGRGGGVFSKSLEGNPGSTRPEHHLTPIPSPIPCRGGSSLTVGARPSKLFSPAIYFSERIRLHTDRSRHQFRADGDDHCQFLSVFQREHCRAQGAGAAAGSHPERARGDGANDG